MIDAPIADPIFVCTLAARFSRDGTAPTASRRPCQLVGRDP
jgi:hypothetical protein